MGSCETSDVIEIEQPERKIYQSKNMTKEDIEESIKRQKEEFPDMPEWKGNRYKGIGIKKMKGYICNLQIDKLIEKREEFWGLRNNSDTPNYKTWRIINQACVYDEYRANVLLEESGLTTADGTINHIIDKRGNHYMIPNYCINDPYFEKEYKLNEEVEEKKFKIKMYETSQNLTIDMEVSNKLTGAQLKEEFIKKAKYDNNIKIRLFFSGQEIRDEHFLYQHSLQNGFKIQVMKVTLTPGTDNKKNNVKKSKKKKEQEPEPGNIEPENGGAE